VAEGEAVNRDDQGRPWWRTAPAGWLKAAASASTALGLVTYAVLRIDYALFYGRFGLKPEDVGLGQTDLIAQSLSGVLILLAVLFFELLALAASFFFVWVVGRQLWSAVRATRSKYGTVAAVLLFSILPAVILGQVIGATPAGPWVLLAVGLVSLLSLLRPPVRRNLARGSANSSFSMFLVVVFALSLAFRLSPRWTAVGFALLIAIAAVIKRVSGRRAEQATTATAAEATATAPAESGLALAAGSPAGEHSGEDEAAVSRSSGHQGGSSPATLRAILVAVVLVTVVLDESLLALSAISDANQVRTGHAVAPTVLGIPLVSWGARRVLVAWTGSAPAGLEALADHCLLYLGQGSGAVLLYDRDSGTTVRVASGALVLSIRPEANYKLVCPG